MNDTPWLVTDYFDTFKCKCGDCRHTCCGGWRIAVGEKEYYRIIGMDCSQKLHERIEGAFVRPDFPTPERYMLMEADWTGRCRMLDEDGMCMLQKECGEDAITEVCRVYPRSYKSENGIYNACCSASCEATVECLLRREPLTFRVENEDRFAAGHSVKAEITDHVDYNLDSVFHETIAVLQDRTKPLPERISLISTLSGLEASVSSAGTEDYVSSVRTHAIRDSIRSKGLYNTILPIITEFSDEAPSFTEYVDEFGARYTSENFDEQFGADLKDFEAHFPDWSCYFENLICNNMLYAAFPAVDKRVNPKQAVLGLTLQYTLLRVMCACHTAASGWTQENLVDVIAELYHVIEHTAFYFNSIVLLS